MNYFDTKVVGRKHLLKRSILLLKAWMTYESSLLGSQLACLATYGMYTLAIYIFNNFSVDKNGQPLIVNEMDFLRKFFDVFGKFDWDEQIITIYGSIRKQGLKWQDRLKDEFNFDISAMAMSERQLSQSSAEKSANSFS